MGVQFNSPMRDHKAWSFITSIASLLGTLFQRFLVMEMGWIGMRRELVSWPRVKLGNTGATGLDAKVRSSEFRWSHLMCIFWKTKMLGEDVVWKSHYEAVVRPSCPHMNVLQIVRMPCPGRIWNYDFDELGTTSLTARKVTGAKNPCQAWFLMVLAFLVIVRNSIQPGCAIR